ncbi:MAG: DUF1735 domain-containing protein [Bacteroidales bacterium]|nr:DUF1735 domain-containing protein [Bacteroidales bacterium]
MKKITLALLFTAALCGCMKDDRNKDMVDDSFGITAKEPVIVTSVHTGSCPVGIAKNGKGLSAASVSISSDASLLDAYNKANNTSYEALPQSAYSISDSSLSYETEDVVKTVSLSWDAVQLAELIGGRDDMVIPLTISSSDDKVKVNPDRNMVIVRILRSSLSVTQALLLRSVSKRNVEPDDNGRVPSLTETITMDLECTNAIKDVGMDFPVAIDNSLIPAYNASAEEPAVQAPDGLVKLLADNVSIPEGGKSASYKAEINKALLLDGSGKLQEFPDYVVPLKVDSEHMKASFRGEDFSLKGLDYGNMVTYLRIHYVKATGSVVITREWGRYSTAEASWNGYFGGSAGSDRNLAMDDDYIYIAEFNSTKNLWAIDLHNPENVKKLPVGTVESTGLADIYLTCPRVLRNEDPNLNDGKDILVVSNLATGQKLMMYFYSNGIAADPSPVTFNIWMDRRLGDTWTFWGTVQKGMFYMKDFENATALLTFKQEGRVAGSNSLQGRFEMPDVGGGAAAYWPFPDNKNAGMYGVRNKVNSYSVQFQSDSWSAIGGNETTSTQLDGYFENCAFQYIEFAGKRYVAYTRQVDGNDGRLFVLEGAATDTWESIVTKRNVIYHAAIQNDFEGEGEVEASPKASTHNGMDLCAREIGGDMYIAVVKQNVGLSLFKMSVN